MKLAEKLIYLRKEKRLSQLKLAELMNVSRQAVSRWEVGAATPSTENLKYLSGLYGVTMEYLLDDGEDGPGERAPSPAGGPGKKSVLRLAIAAVCVFALGAGVAFGIMGLGNRESGGEAAGEIGTRVYDGYVVEEPDGELIGGQLAGVGVITTDGGLARMVSNPDLDRESKPDGTFEVPSGFARSGKQHRRHAVLRH